MANNLALSLQALTLILKITYPHIHLELHSYPPEQVKLIKFLIEYMLKKD